MSINHYYSSSSEGHWWSQYSTMDSPPAQTSSSSNSHPNNPFISSAPRFWLTPVHLSAAPMLNAFDLNNEDDDELTDEHAQEQEIPKERLFEKPLTPSDVGKLNRLVIPKQHAEKHFPLNGGSDSGENGLLLGFEDEVGKAWRFRYSYWNSSQSYVLTKGWSRFVKEKRLDAGDIVIFSRHRVDTGRHFIGWRRRNSQDSQPPTAVGSSWGRVYYNSGQPNYHQIQQQTPASNSLSYQPTLHAGEGGGGSEVRKQNQKQTRTTSSAGSGNSKTVRLFGVNLECHATATATDDSEPSTPVGSPYHQQYSYYSSNHHMDISFSGGAADVYRQG